MPTVRLRVAHLPRLPTFPLDDDALGAELWRELSARLAKGAPRPTLLAFWSDRAQVVDLAPLLAPGTDVHRAISSFAGQPGIEALATSSVMIQRQHGRETGRNAVVFVEWPDGRWWSCTRRLESGGLRVADAHDEVERAIDGAAKPHGLGSWFSRARFEGLQVRMEPSPEETVN
jgi:hypothetical protein